LAWETTVFFKKKRLAWETTVFRVGLFYDRDHWLVGSKVSKGASFGDECFLKKKEWMIVDCTGLVNSLRRVVINESRRV
jgi:hypothetical protein